VQIEAHCFPLASSISGKWDAPAEVGLQSQKLLERGAGEVTAGLLLSVAIHDAVIDRQRVMVFCFNI